MIFCAQCNAPVPAHVRNCQACQNDVGFPNVRAAQDTKNIAALGKRLSQAEVSANARNSLGRLKEFGIVASDSKAVVCTQFGVLDNLVSSDNTLYASFYLSVQGQSRLPEDNEWDRARPSVDGVLFPYYADQIRFGFLSLDMKPLKYGPYAMVLRTKLIDKRATVFEENSIVFCREKHKVVAGEPLPLGYRAIWNDKDKLAMAKLNAAISERTPAVEFPRILCNSATEEFIEVHIFGPIHRMTIEKVVGPEPKRREDRLIWRSLERKLKGAGATLEIA